MPAVLTAGQGVLDVFADGGVDVPPGGLVVPEGGVLRIDPGVLKGQFSGPEGAAIADVLINPADVQARNLRQERDPAKRTSVLDEIDTGTVTRRLMDILDIRNQREQAVAVTETHVAEIKEYLRALELIVDPGRELQLAYLISAAVQRLCGFQQNNVLQHPGRRG